MTFWQRLSFTWSLLWDAAKCQLCKSWSERDPSGVGVIVLDLMDTDEYRAAKFAVDKVNNDPDLNSAPDDLKREEAVEWAGHYLREGKIAVRDWPVRFLLELAVGVGKGKL